MNWSRLSDWGRHHPAFALGLAIILAVAALSVRIAIGPILVGYPFLTFFPAIVLATFVGGRFPGAVCGALSTLFAWYWLIAPQGTLGVGGPGGVLALAAFTTIATLIVIVIDGLVRANVAARTHAAARDRLTAELETRVADRTRKLTEAYDQLKREGDVREAAEEQVRRLQRLEAVGQLTGGIAHDFNNMLSIILGNLNLATHRLKQGEVDIVRYIDNASEGAVRAASLTKRLLAFARRQPLQPVVVDVNKLVTGMSELLQRTLGEPIRIETVLTGGAWLTEVDPGQLENAIVNLAVNARDAMPDGGTLSIEVQNAFLDEHYAAADPDLTPGQYVLLAVSDTGEGMAPEVASKAFEPFFTTKDSNRGTGLGLSQIYGFVKQSGGHVRIYSELSQGTTVKLYLRRHCGTGLPAAPTGQTEAMPRGSTDETILVVEDEAGVRAISVEALERLGYTVIAAEDGPSGLALLRGKADIALLFTDVVMPGMSGRELSEAASRLRPGLRTLYTTGYTRNSIVHKGRLNPGVDLLQKPFTTDQLARKIRLVLDRGA